MQVKSLAKINWSLRVTGKRADGYHDLETLFQTISLHDTIGISGSEKMVIVCDDHNVPCDETNLAMRAARAIDSPPVYIALQKRIPAGGGLGGGSSNAAAMLVALDEMFAMHTPKERLQELALALGSDVPFFLIGGTAYATGRGEQLTPLPSAAPIPLLLIFPDVRVSTADAFSRIRNYSKPIGLDRYREMLRDDLLAHEETLINDFEEPIFAQHRSLRELRERLKRAGAAWARMTGSGSTMVGAFRTQSQRDKARDSFRDVRCATAETV